MNLLQQPARGMPVQNLQPKPVGIDTDPVNRR